MIGEVISQNILLPLMYVLVDVCLVCIICLLLLTVIDKIQDRW
jgi:hypothetical protein